MNSYKAGDRDFTRLWQYIYSKYIGNVGEEEELYLQCRGALPLSQYRNGLFQKKNQTGGGLLIYFFENPLEFLGFCFTSGNSKQNKSPPLEPP